LPHFKPSGFSPELMLSVNYLSHGLIKREVVAEFLGTINPSQDLLVQEYDLNLQMVERKYRFHHIPKVLLTQVGWAIPDNSEKLGLIQAHLTRLGLTNVGYVEETSGTRFTWGIGDTSLTVVILTKNNHNLLETLLASMQLELHQYNININIVDNGSDDASTLAYYERISREPIISIIPFNQTFNYSEAINLGVQESTSDLVLLLNDDMQIRTPGGLEELLRWAVRPDVGVVGTKLLRANHTIQHAGIIMGLSGFAGHIYLNAPEHYWGLFGSVDWYRDYLALTGACQMVRRAVFDEVGGYDNGYQLAFGDLDFCLRVHALGYRNVYTPYASMFHFEGQTRGYITPKADVVRGLDEMQRYLIKGDPYYSPNLTYTRIPKCAFNNTSEENRLVQIETRRDFYF
ncbi:MAG: glycosyltransferase family 2 protein, partial [Anaerolineales bacterium]